MRLVEASFCTIGLQRVLLRSGLLLALVASLSACSALRSPNSPDLVYSSDAESARQLQVPPDLTDISDTEQFVLPGQNGGQIKRNTLLPQFESIQYVRDTGENWLAIDAAPESVWPQVLAFLRKENFRIEQTAPTNGVISTLWRPASSAGDSGLLKNLLGTNEQFSRVAFRLERDGTGTRLFARLQATSEALANNNTDGGGWPASSHDPEATSALLVQLMTFFGVEEQKALGILNDEQASAVLDDAYLQTTSAGSQLLINKGYQPSYDAVLTALSSLDVDVESSSASIGQIQFVSDTTPVRLDLKPLHVSAVVVELTDSSGRPLEAADESRLLNALLDAIV